ncbi:uncharacterized protein [Battus philenor]|uniref:uncharacterized protein n=1 Tax=Battus philenor TaxID=42288 RepID=UPI0035D0A169
MQCKFALILICAVLTRVSTEPDPKKYKASDAEKDKKAGSSLTDDEKKFLHEVEEKFGVKSHVPVENIENETSNKSANTTEKKPLPAVIAIEIVNDTDSKSKDKRTIDANLGYGYRTNEGYKYTYFGKPTQEKGKFVIYPYSQVDVPSQYNENNEGYSKQSSGKKTESTSVEIQPSQAFELVSVKDDQYDDSSKTFEPTQSYTKDTSKMRPSTLYTTYNGEGLSGLSGQFPSLMSNYFVEPKQLLQNPQYQNIGLTSDHLSKNGLDQNRPVVPVLVLRVPSSYLKNPTAELYANLPNNYPHSNYLNNVNLQDLVNQYFTKNGYDSAPRVMTYHNSVMPSSSLTPTSSSYNSEPQQYSNPHVQPSYTQSDFSGVQYSAVKPVMAKYPSGSNSQKYLSSQIQSQYRRPTQEPKYEYRYQYVPQSASHTQAYHQQSQYQNPQLISSYNQQSEHASLVKPSFESGSNSEYGAPQYSVNQDSKYISSAYDSSVQSQTENSNIESQYEFSKESQSSFIPQESLSQDYSSQSVTDLTSSQLSEYLAQHQLAGSVSAYSSPSPNTEQAQQYYSEVSSTEGYNYPKPREEGEINSQVYSETYPNKDYTIATVLPFSYKKAKKPSSATVQTVSYVTPVPNSSKYQSRFRIMVPQTVLTGQEKVTYVNSMPMHYTKAGSNNQDFNAEEYKVSKQYSNQFNRQKHPSYPRSYYHSYPKRMIRPDNKPEVSSQSKKSGEMKVSS